MAAQAEIDRTTSFWRSVISERLASSAPVSRSRWSCSCSSIRRAWSATSRKYRRICSSSSTTIPPLERLERPDQRLDGAMELDHLAAEEVDPLGGVDVAGGEHLALDLGDVVVDARGHRLVVVDDLVEDRPGRRSGPDVDEVGTPLEAQARLLEVAGAAVADRDHVAGAEEEVDLAEVDLLALVVVVRGLEDDEVGAVVVLELRPLMLEVGVLDRELVQAEGLRRARRAPPRSGRGTRARRSRRPASPARPPSRCRAGRRPGGRRLGTGRSRRSRRAPSAGFGADAGPPASQGPSPPEQPY